MTVGDYIHQKSENTDLTEFLTNQFFSDLN